MHFNSNCQHVLSAVRLSCSTLHTGLCTSTEEDFLFQIHSDGLAVPSKRVYALQQEQFLPTLSTLENLQYPPNGSMHFNKAARSIAHSILHLAVPSIRVYALQHDARSARHLSRRILAVPSIRVYALQLLFFRRRHNCFLTCSTLHTGLCTSTRYAKFKETNEESLQYPPYGSMHFNRRTQYHHHRRFKKLAVPSKRVYALQPMSVWRKPTR